MTWEDIGSIALVTSIIVGAAVVYINLTIGNAIKDLEIRVQKRQEERERAQFKLLDGIYMRTETILYLFEKMGSRVGDVEDKQDDKQDS